MVISSPAEGPATATASNTEDHGGVRVALANTSDVAANLEGSTLSLAEDLDEESV